ncbi:MAG: RibD family protein, partial [Sphingobacteriales bacterium]
ILKWAQTADGFIARKDFSSKWISNSYSRLLVHQWRGEEAAILAGTNTVFYDDPQLTSREMKTQNPVRIILDRTGKIPVNFFVFDGNVKTIILTENPQKSSNPNIEFAYISFAKNAFVKQLMQFLCERNLISVFVEGGATLINTFIENNLWDEARVFTAPVLFHEGIQAPEMPKHFLQNTYMLKQDKLQIYSNVKG